MELIFNTTYDIFRALMFSGDALFVWLTSPFEDEIIVGAFGNITPIELMFGLSVTLVLVHWLVKFIM